MRTATGLAITLGAVFTVAVASSSFAATVVDTYTWDTSSALNNAIYASGFTPSADYDFTGESAFVGSSSPTSQPVGLALYSSSGGAPGSLLWSSGTLTVGANASTLFTENYSGSPIPLQSGVEYFVAVDATASQVGWLYTEGASVPIYASTNHAQSFFLLGGPFGTPQFQVFGAALSTPEPSTWAMMLIGFAAVGYAGYRAKSKARHAAT
jgi:PEP-CTERM motif